MIINGFLHLCPGDIFGAKKHSDTALRHIPIAGAGVFLSYQNSTIPIRLNFACG
jgi:hypothetical protein